MSFSFMAKEKIVRLTLEMPETVVNGARERAEKNRRSRNSQIVHDVEMANNQESFVLNGLKLGKMSTKEIQSLESNGK